MAKNIIIKLTKSSGKVGPFTIYDQLGNIIAENVDKSVLIEGMSYSVEDSVTSVKLVNTGSCNGEKTHAIEEEITSLVLASTHYEREVSTCLWKHLVAPELFNSFYGETHPYVLEIPFNYNEQTEILQSLKDYSRVYKYIPSGTGVFNNYEKVELDDAYFNNLIIYNGQQNSGLLELVKKPKNNLSQYSTYPIYRESSKVVTYTKSDNFYNINNFWDCVKDKSIPQFITDCESLSTDKKLNSSNMDYSKRSYNKSPIRAKDVKLRFTLNDRSDIHITSQMIFNNNQLSYK